MDTRITLGLLGAAGAAALALVFALPAETGAEAQLGPPAQAQPQAQPQAQQPVTITVSLSQWSVAPSAPSVPAGVPVRFVAQNDGSISHQLQVTAPGMPNVDSAVLAPGDSY